MRPKMEIGDPEATVLAERPETPSQRGKITPEEKQRPGEKPQILAELVIEEISIDGMCGVY